MDDRFRADFRRGALAGLIAATMAAFLAGLAVRAYAADEKPVPAESRPAAVTARWGDRPGDELSRPAGPAGEDCPQSSSPGAER